MEGVRWCKTIVGLVAGDLEVPSAAPRPMGHPPIVRVESEDHGKGLIGDELTHFRVPSVNVNLFATPALYPNLSAMLKDSHIGTSILENQP